MFFQTSARRTKSGPHSRRRPGRRLDFEPLEGRRLLSVTAGDFDPTFGDGGYTAESFPGPASDFARDVTVVQTDGKIIVAGMSATARYDGDIALARYNSNGTLDTTFGTAGQVTTDFDNGSEDVNAMALQSDGKIVVAGSYSPDPWASDADFFLARFHSDGTLDTTFGDNGKAVLDFAGSSDQIWGLGIRPDGKIVAAGNAVQASTSTDFAIARFNSDGSLDDGGSNDTTPGDVFGVAGRVTTDFASSADFAYDMALQADGKIVLAGAARPGGTTGSDFALARYHSDGSLDTSFGSGGKVTLDTGDNSHDYARAVEIQSDGKIVAAGRVELGSHPDFGVIRYNTDGSLDDDGPSDITPGDEFGVGGIAVAEFGPYITATASDMALQADGKIVVAGSTYASGAVGGDFALARFNMNGSLDDGSASDSTPGDVFGVGGKLTTDLGSTSEGALAVTVQADGKILATGRSLQSATDGDFALVRYEVSGFLDTTFGTGGWATTNFTGSVSSYGESMAIQPDGKIVVAGLASMPDGSTVALARFHSDGTLDSGFGNGGTVAGGFNGSARRVALQSDGKIVVAGYSSQLGTGADFAIARFNADGSPDDGGPNDSTPGDAFGIGGLVSTDFGDGDLASDYASGLAVQTDGRIVVTGYSYTFATGNAVAAARYNSDGSLDSSFGVGGQVLNDFGFGIYSVLATDMTLQDDEKVVVVGYAYDQVHGDQFFVGRFNADGSLDDGNAGDLTPGDKFGSDGKVLTQVGASTSWASSIAVQADNKLVVAGGARKSNNDLVFGLARYNTDGSLDAAFGGDGILTTDFGSSGSYADDVSIGPDGKIVAVGKSYKLESGTDDLALARYNPDGSLDANFGTGGIAIADIDGTHDYGFAVAVLDNADIIVAGYSSGWTTGSNIRILVARFIGDPPPVVLGVDVGLDMQSLIIQLNDDDLDAASVADLTNYVLKASGGDGNGDGDWFNDGDEVLLTISASHYDAGLDQIVLETSDVLFEDLFWLGIDGDDTSSDGTVGITDATGHHLAGGDFSAEFNLRSLTLIQDLLTHVEGLGLSNGAESSLTSKLEAVLHMMDADVDPNAGILALMDAFIRGVEKRHLRGEIGLSDRDDLMDQALLIKRGFMLLEESSV